MNEMKAGKLSTGRFHALRTQITKFSNWVGSNSPIAVVGHEDTVENYYNYLLGQIGDSLIKQDYANDLLNTMKQFVRWAWETQEIAELPRTLCSAAFRIGKALRAPEVLTTAEVQALLQKAAGRTRLYLLLMLNCGMTQKDISDLKHSEVDWTNGAVIRKRSKTRRHDHVPTVRHLLWRETFTLLEQYRSIDPDRVLVNANGDRLKTEVTTEDGKLRKCDNVQSAYRRLCVKVGIKKPVKLMRNTSASLLFTNDRFRSLRGLFLGHAPSDIADRDYTAVPGSTLDEAVRWLAEQYKVS